MLGWRHVTGKEVIAAPAVDALVLEGEPGTFQQELDGQRDIDSFNVE